MRSFVSILLLLVMCAFATGLLQALHEQEHQREFAARHALEQAAAPAGATPDHAPLKPAHTDDDCPLCAQFHAPIISISSVTWLMDTGTWVRYLSMLAVSQQLQAIPERLHCRGPPPVFSC